MDIQELKNKTLQGCGCVSIGIVILLFIVILIGIYAEDEEQETSKAATEQQDSTTVKKDSGDKIKISADTAGAAILKNQKSSGRSEFETRYCYSEQERIQAVKDLSPNPEITRFKGLGEIPHCGSYL